jgi:hypothetical protein
MSRFVFGSQLNPPSIKSIRRILYIELIKLIKFNLDDVGGAVELGQNMRTEFLPSVLPHKNLTLS